MSRRATPGDLSGLSALPVRHGKRGFTLVEMIVGLGVVSVAVSVFVALYGASVDLSRTASNHSVAANLAEERLAGIVSSPAAYKWLLPEPVEETRFPIQLTGEDPPAGNPVALPAAMPAEPVAFRRQDALYSKFRWEAFGKLAEGGAYYEVTVVVRYTEQGREQLLALTSAVPAVNVPDSAVLRKQEGGA